MTSRRHFLKTTLASSALISLAGGVPRFLSQASAELCRRELPSDETILVVLQLTGGNDGLNTVVPYGDDAYYRNRFTLAIGADDVLKIDDYHGLHPSLRGFDRLLQDGQLAIVQGVGYPNPNRSHFESMDLWHTAHRVDERQGWLARTVSQFPCCEAAKGDGSSTSCSTACNSALVAIHLGGEVQPLALASRQHATPSIRSLDQFRLMARQNAEVAEFVERSQDQARSSNDDLLAYVQENARLAWTTAQRLEEFVQRQAAGGVRYPQTGLGSKLQSIARLIGSGLPARIYYVALDGFDTHANQAEAHAALLSEMGDAVDAFMRDLSEQGHGDRVALVTFSEFGRRVRENASRGTDHGTAAPMFLVGGNIAAGLRNAHPSFDDLQDGDFRHAVDYRSVYATLLDDWLRVDSTAILGDNHPRLELLT